MPIVTLDQAAQHLHLDIVLGESPTDPQEADLELKVTQAQAIIFNYLKLEADADPDAESPALWTETERACVQAAVLLALSALYDDERDRTLTEYMAPNTGVIPLLLMRLRSPALA